MSAYANAYHWDDEPSHVERAYKRNWRGMPLRSDWNDRASMRHCQLCPSCGYRWETLDFTYHGDVLRNGEPAPLAVHQVCWNCHQLDTRPEEIARIWAAADRPQLGTGSPKLAALKPLGGR